MPLIISADGGSDPPGGSDDPLDDDPEQRFGDPVRYFSELEDIEEDIALYRSNSITGDYELNVSFPSAAVLSSIVVQSDTGFVEMQTVITQRMLKPSSTSSTAGHNVRSLLQLRKTYSCRLWPPAHQLPQGNAGPNKRCRAGFIQGLLH